MIIPLIKTKTKKTHQKPKAQKVKCPTSLGGESRICPQEPGCRAKPRPLCYGPLPERPRPCLLGASMPPSLERPAAHTLTSACKALLHPSSSTWAMPTWSGITSSASLLPSPPAWFHVPLKSIPHPVPASTCWLSERLTALGPGVLSTCSLAAGIMPSPPLTHLLLLAVLLALVTSEWPLTFHPGARPSPRR